MKIEACIGSSCHVRGAPKILSLLKKAIEDNKIQDKVELVGSICLGHCKESGANLKIDGEVVTGITAENFDDFFKERVLQKL